MLRPRVPQMRDSWREKWNLFWLHGIPLWTTLLLMFFCLIPSDSVKVNYFRPEVGFICVFYWTLKKEYIFSYISAFTVGFFMDAFSSSPLGVNILLMMLTVFVTQWLIHYFQGTSFGAGWFMFGLVGLGIFILKWLLLSIYYHMLISTDEIIFNYLATLLFYPLIAAINMRVQKFMPQERIDE